MKFFKYFFATFLGVIFGFMAAVLMAVGLITFLISSADKMSAKSSQTTIPDKSFLVLDLSDEIRETKDEFSMLFGSFGKLSLSDYVEIIKLAEKDPLIKGIYLSLSEAEHGWSTLKTIRKSLMDFKATGKPIYSYSSAYNEKSYYISSVATQVFLHPQGEFSWDGLGASPTFYQGTFEKFGVKPIVFRVGQFKSAVEPYTQKQMSPQNKRQINELIDDVWQELISAVSVDRELSEETLNEMAESLQVRSADEAFELKLVDELKSESEIFESLILKKDVTKIVKDDFKKLVSVTNYWANKKGDQSFTSSLFGTADKDFTKTTLALITIEGVIMPGRSSDGVVGADDVVSKILKAKYSKNIKGVVVRINSPGGSALASDVIWTELKKLREVKPVYASFGDVAASGGYYIGVAAEKIFAHENTITGSIGVYSILLNIEKGANERLDLTFDRVVTHPFADRGSPVRAMSSQEATFFQEDTNRIYQRFVEVVQLGREFDTFENVDSIAQGRVWSGVQAKEIGLVDEFGGLEDAVKSLAQQLKLPKSFDVKEIPNEIEFEFIFKGFFSKLKSDLVKLFGFSTQLELPALNSSKISKDKIWSLSPKLNIE
jgi:protease IV